MSSTFYRDEEKTPKEIRESIKYERLTYYATVTITYRISVLYCIVFIVLYCILYCFFCDFDLEQNIESYFVLDLLKMLFSKYVIFVKLLVCTTKKRYFPAYNLLFMQIAKYKMQKFS
jgi:uncharacterized protein YqhQ